MDEREREAQRIEYTKRNEKNKIWQKRMKIYSTVAWGTLLLEFLLSLFVSRERFFILYIMGAIFILWIIWTIGGYIVLTCPHCDRCISHIAGIDCCPYCGTKLGVFPDLEPPEEK